MCAQPLATNMKLLPKLERLSFGKGSANGKLSSDFDARSTITFSLSAGTSCPGAKKCKAYVDKGGVLHAKPKQSDEFVCYAAEMEKRRPNVRRSRERNFSLLRACKTQKEMVDLIVGSHSFEVKRARIHVSGDMYNENYFKAWMEVAAAHPDVQFYAYTKSLKTWVDNKELVPPNFRLTASKGGTHDHLIAEHALKYAEVVFSETQAAKLGLEIDHDDSHAWKDEKPFALLLHGSQQKGSVAAKALWALRAQGHTGYSKAKG